MKKKEKLIPFEVLEKRWMKNAVFRREYEALEPEFALIRSLIEKRLAAGLTQEGLAQRIGTRQSVISRLESGEANPSLGTLRKVAKALNAEVRVILQ